VVILANGKVAAEGAVDAVLGSDDPLVVQYLHARPDGPVRFHFPGASVEADFRLATQ
jgi:phospholipid/cholesterol/gamma-HCH transport system ATP-binding protein